LSLWVNGIERKGVDYQGKKKKAYNQIVGRISRPFIDAMREGNKVVVRVFQYDMIFPNF
jgi:hypothetical protein